jgi:hypothetical protein
MSYPSLPLTRNSTAERAGGFEPVRATNGLLKVRRLYSTEKTIFRLEHILNDTQKNTLETAYTTNRTLNLTFTWPLDGVSYTVRFADAPQYRKQGPIWFANVTIMQV